MPVGRNQSLDYYSVDAKNACINERRNGDNQRVGDYIEGRFTNIKLEQWEHEGQPRYTVKILLGRTECVTFSLQTTFGRMAIARLAHAAGIEFDEYNKPRPGSLNGVAIRLTPYFFGETCCAALRINGQKYAGAIVIPKPVEVQVGTKLVRDDANVITFLSDVIKAMSFTGKHSHEAIATNGSEGAEEGPPDDGYADSHGGE